MNRSQSLAVGCSIEIREKSNERSEPPSSFPPGLVRGATKASERSSESRKYRLHLFRDSAIWIDTGGDSAAMGDTHYLFFSPKALTTIGSLTLTPNPSLS